MVNILQVDENTDFSVFVEQGTALSHLHGVQGVASSNLVTPTIKKAAFWAAFFYFLFAAGPTSRDGTDIDPDLAGGVINARVR